jgi:glycosyl transferase/beta-hydroxylase protein BlmF
MISLLVPTRGRPHNMERFYDSAHSTATRGEFEIIFYIDDDDQPSIDKAAELPNVVSAIGPRIVLSECWNRCAEVSLGTILFHGGDDIVFQTDGWDDMVEGTFADSEDKILFVHGRDGYHDARFGTHGFIHRRWMDALNYFVPPLFSSDFNDAWLNDLANALDRRVYLPDLFTEHRHYVFGKAPHDDTYKEREARGAADNVLAIYAATADQRAADVEKLRAVMKP